MNIFNSTIRREIPAAIFLFYKKISQRVSYREILKYVRSRRYKKDIVSFYYVPYITGIILSDSINKELEGDNANEILNIKNYIERGRLFINRLKNNPFDGNLCDCDLIHRENKVPDCNCCVHKMVEFANDCIINIVDPHYKYEIYKFLIFKQNKLVDDINNKIGIILLDII